jgi:hypothetical protein
MRRFNKHIIITGSARSGTSWLSEVIARQFRYRMLFEPEHEFNTEKGKLLCDRWIKRKEEAPKVHQYLKKVFSNRVDSDWIGQVSNRKYKMHLWPFLPKKYIIKFVRANLSAKYMNEKFQIPVIHIIRNPYDVIASQQRVKFPWLFNLEHFKNQTELVKLVKEKFNFDLLKTEDLSALEILTLRWCLENVLSLQVFEPYQYKHRVIKHEDLRNDLQIFLNLCKDFNITPIANIGKEYKRPSSKTHPKSTIIDNTKNDEKFTLEEMHRINGMLKVFQCKLYPIIE